METGSGGAEAARRMVGLGHVLVGASALVVAGAMVINGSSPDAGLGGVFLGLGLLVALAGAVFLFASVLAVRRGPKGPSGLCLVLSMIELAVGVGMTGALVLAVQGYGAFEPWRSPLLLPSALLLILGVAGVALEVAARHTHASHTP